MSFEKRRSTSKLSEPEVIALFSRPPKFRAALYQIGNGDDALVLAPDEHASVVSTDTLVEGVHFRSDWSTSGQIGRKLMAVNLSDMAAMGAEPHTVLFSLCLPGGVSSDWVQGVAEGAHTMCDDFEVDVGGGNVSYTEGPAILTGVILGRCSSGASVPRKSARVGDSIFVSGHLGSARLGLECLALGMRDSYESLVEAQLSPLPRCALGALLRERGLVTAMCDVSDGLAADVRTLVDSKQHGVTVFVESLPIEEESRRFCSDHDLNVVEFALDGGEEYELLISTDPSNKLALERVAQELGITLTEIGIVTAQAGDFVCEGENGRCALPAGFCHEF